MATITSQVSQEEVQFLLLNTISEMQKTMNSMNSNMTEMQEKMARIDQSTAKSNRIAEKFDVFHGSVGWSVRILDQIRSFKHPLLGWTPFGRVNMNLIEDINPGTKQDQPHFGKDTTKIEGFEDNESVITDVDPNEESDDPVCSTCVDDTVEELVAKYKRGTLVIEELD